jgi:hypothetical protein
MSITLFCRQVLLVLREHCVLNRKAYLSYGLFVFLFIFLFLLGGKKWSAEDGSLMVGQKLLLLFMVLFSISESGVLFVRHLSRQAGNVHALTLPVTPSSRLCAGMLWGGIVVPLALSVLFYLALTATLPFFPEHHFGWMSPLELLTGGLNLGTGLYPSNMFFNALMYQLLFMAGGIYFKSSPWIKTWICVWVFSLLLVGVTFLVTPLLVPGFSMGVAAPGLYVVLEHYMNGVTMYPWLLVSGCMYYALAYYLLREKQA